MASVFTRIIRGEIPSHRVAEDDRHYAFLDINPVAKGHTLVVPKKEVDYLFDLPEEDYLALQAFAYRLAPALRRAVPCLRIGVAVVGLEVPHVHIHLIPLNSMGDINFSKPKVAMSQEALAGLAAAVRAELG